MKSAQINYSRTIAGNLLLACSMLWNAKAYPNGGGATDPTGHVTFQWWNNAAAGEAPVFIFGVDGLCWESWEAIVDLAYQYESNPTLAESDRRFIDACDKLRKTIAIAHKHARRESRERKNAAARKAWLPTLGDALAAAQAAQG